MLTDFACKTLISLAKKNNTRLKKADKDGLFLFAQPSGKAYWRHKYYFQGKEKLISYGLYPLVALSEAREKHNSSCKLLQQGKDPSKIRQDKAIAETRLANNTFKALSLKWYSHNLSGWDEYYAYKIRRCMKGNLFPSIGDIPVTELTGRQILEAVQIVEARGAYYMARWALKLCENILDYAKNNEYIQFNIATGLNKCLKKFKRGHYPSMEIDMLPDFIAKLDKNEANISQDLRDNLELLLLTMVRPSELRKAVWAEFDFDKAMWTIPAARMKMRQVHLVPLSPRAVTILKRRKAEAKLEEQQENSKYVFLSRIKLNKPIDRVTVSDALIRMGYQDIHCAHGFRALAMGIAKEKLGYRHEIPDRQLSHAPKGAVNRAYDRAKFLPERIEMMDKLANYIEDLRRPTTKKWAFTLKKSANSFQFMPSNYTIQITAHI